MADPHYMASCTPPGAQAVLLHLPADQVPSYAVLDRTGTERARSSALGVVVTAARFLVIEQGEAWIRASDDTTAHLGPDGVSTDTPSCPWIQTLTTCLET